MERKKVGRPVGKSDAKATILQCARQAFSNLGYEHTTVRGVAAAAKVDAALVAHYFKTKYELFLAAMLPVYDGPSLLTDVLAGDRSEFGKRLAVLFIHLMESPESHTILMGMVRAAASEQQAAEVLRDFIEEHLLRPIAQFLGRPDAALRASLIGSQMVGLLVTRYVTKLEPLVSASSQEIAALLSPTLQRYVD